MHFDAQVFRELHREFILHLLKAMRKANPAVDLLAVTRATLRDQGVSGLAQDEEDHKRLRRLHKLHTKHLLEAMEGPGKPSAAMLSEVRIFLHDNGAMKDLAGFSDTTRALQALSLADLPFKGVTQ